MILVINSIKFFKMLLIHIIMYILCLAPLVDMTHSRRGLGHLRHEHVLRAQRWRGGGIAEPHGVEAGFEVGSGVGQGGVTLLVRLHGDRTALDWAADFELSRVRVRSALIQWSGLSRRMRLTFRSPCPPGSRG